MSGEEPKLSRQWFERRISAEGVTDVTAGSLSPTASNDLSEAMSGEEPTVEELLACLKYGARPLTEGEIDAVAERLRALRKQHEIDEKALRDYEKLQQHRDQQRDAEVAQLREQRRCLEEQVDLAAKIVLSWADAAGWATGHGDTLADMLDEVRAQERKENAKLRERVRELERGAELLLDAQRQYRTALDKSKGLYRKLDAENAKLRERVAELEGVVHWLEKKVAQLRADSERLELEKVLYAIQKVRRPQGPGWEGLADRQFNHGVDAALQVVRDRHRAQAQGGGEE